MFVLIQYLFKQKIPFYGNNHHNIDSNAANKIHDETASHTAYFSIHPSFFLNYF
jgi:hypothetical protein